MILENISRLLRKQYEPLNIIEIDKQRLINNYQYLSSLNNKIQIAPVLKSNGYGHGIVEIGSILDELRPVFFCVDSIYEAYQLLKAKIKSPILITGYVDPKNLAVKKLPFSYAVFSSKQLREILKVQPQAKVHLFVDTGMNREGIRIDELEDFLKELEGREKSSIDGLMSHFAYSERPDNLDTKNQVDNFKKALFLIKKYLIFPKYIHFGNSSGLLNNKKLELGKISNVSRAGLSIYGISSIKNNELKSVLQLKTQIVQIKKIKKGEKVGYDFTYQAKKDGLIAVLPVGYNDGVDRRLSDKGVVLIKGKLCPIIGRISMNICVVDISLVRNPRVGDEVVVFSKNSNENNIVNPATKIGTISYELLVHLPASIKRTIV